MINLDHIKFVETKKEQGLILIKGSLVLKQDTRMYTNHLSENLVKKLRIETYLRVRQAMWDHVYGDLIEPTQELGAECIVNTSFKNRERILQLREELLNLLYPKT